jgi:hypothetical protein
MKEFSLLKKFNWQTASQPIVKKYIADLRQSGIADPTAITLFNNTDITFTYEYLSPGIYMVIASKPIFFGCGMGCPQQTTQVNITNPSYIGSALAPYGYSIVNFAADNSSIMILTSDLGAVTDGILGNGSQNCLEITFYN